MLKSEIDNLKQLPLSDLQSEAFTIRKQEFGDQLTFSIPGAITYSDRTRPFSKDRFAAISVTGTRCDLHCGHCRGKLLESMIAAEDPETLSKVLERLESHGALGALLSGGADKDGAVPLDTFIRPISAIKTRSPSFKIICHTGLIGRETAMALKEAGVDQVLLDVIGDNDTIRQVYHLDKSIEDYEETLRMLKEIGHRLAPHIIVGHHFGEIRGEWKALDMVTRIGVETIVFVVLKPLDRSDTGHLKIPAPGEVSRISAAARILNPKTPIRMGCIRPAHPWKAEMEKGCINSGVNTIAYPLQTTIEYAGKIGLRTRFVEMCCSLI